MKKYKRGFTFVELIAVIAVLIVIAALFIPRYLNLRRESNRIVCNTNIDTLKICYSAAAAMNSEETPKKILSAVMRDNSDISCPLGYVFVSGIYEDEPLFICPEHGSRTIDSADLIVKAISHDMYSRTFSLISDISGLSIREKQAYFEERGFDASLEFLFENTFINEYILKTEYSESWPVISDDYAKKHKIPKGLSIQPYIVNASKPENILLFAAGDAVEMLYIDGAWYYRDGGEEIDLTKSFNTIVRNATTLWTPIL